MTLFWLFSALLFGVGQALWHGGMVRAFFSLSLFMVGFSFFSPWEYWRQIFLYFGAGLLIVLAKAVRFQLRRAKRRGRSN